MKTSEAGKVIQACVAACLPMLLVGEPGVGKTDLVGWAQKALKADMIVSHPAVADPTDAKGLPWANAGDKEATFLPFGDLAKALRAKKKTIWFLDDLGQASPAVQAAFMQLLLARRIGEHVLPHHITFVAATNERKHKAGVTGLLTPVVSRFATIIHVIPDLEDWKNWAYGANIREEVIGFLNFRGINKKEPAKQLFHVFDANAAADLKNYPCPRTWHSVSKLLDAGVPKEQEREVFAGAVGEQAASEFVGYLKVRRELPNPDAILVDPDQARIPEEPSALYATATALAARCKDANFGRISKYAQRLHAGGMGEFGALMVRDSVRTCPDVQNTTEFARLLTTDLGKLLMA